MGTVRWYDTNTPLVSAVTACWAAIMRPSGTINLVAQRWHADGFKEPADEKMKWEGTWDGFSPDVCIVSLSRASWNHPIGQLLQRWMQTRRYTTGGCIARQQW